METKTVTKWAVDPSHSEISFRVRHLVISNVRGKFEKFEGFVEQENDSFENAYAEFKADTASINTGVNDRDVHLRSDDFFNSESYPDLLFKSTGIKKIDENHYKLSGDLTIRDVTKPIELDVEYGGTVTDPYGNTKAGFELRGAINRKDYNLKWNAVTEAGSVVVADEVKLELNVQLVKQ